MTKREQLIKLLTEDPTLSNKQLHKLTGISKRHIRRVKSELDLERNVEEVEQEIDYEKDCKLALMAGLKKMNLPAKYKSMLADLVYSVEKSLDRIPEIKLSSSTDKEAACLLISDIHAGKRVYDDKGSIIYDKNICAYRLALLSERVINLLTKHLHIKSFDEFNIILLGDIIDGSGIYPNQELNQDLTYVSDQIALAVAGIWDLITRIRNLGIKVRVFGCLGNHGKQSHYSPEGNNFDYIVYQMLYMLAKYEKTDIEVYYSTTASYYNFEVKGKKVHIRHKAPPQPETPSARSKFFGWKDMHDWHIMCYAHNHHPASNPFMNAETFMNGSLLEWDDFSESLSVYSRPSQTLFGVDSEIGVTFIYRVYLDSYGKGDEYDKLMLKYPILKGE